MKTLLILIGLISFQLNAQKMVSRYKAGFQYYNQQGAKVTLIEWVKTGTFMGNDLYRWKTKNELLGVTAFAWTDDCWIDVATDKAFLNARTHQIVYYDSVDIIPKRAVGQTEKNKD